MADALHNEPGVDVDLINGDRGELTVTVDGKQVAKKGFFSMPTVDKVLAAVRKAEPVTAG